MDMRKITSEILATGLTQQELAGRVPCGQATISSFLTGKRGVRPSLRIGQRLLELHHELVPPQAQPCLNRRHDDRPPAAVEHHHDHRDPAQAQVDSGQRSGGSP